MLVPVGSAAMDKLAPFPPDIIYEESVIDALRTNRIDWTLGQQSRSVNRPAITVWQKTPVALDIGGTDYEVWVNRFVPTEIMPKPTNIFSYWSSGTREHLHYERRFGTAEALGGKLIAFRVGDGYGE